MTKKVSLPMSCMHLTGAGALTSCCRSGSVDRKNASLGHKSVLLALCIRFPFPHVPLLGLQVLECKGFHIAIWYVARDVIHHANKGTVAGAFCISLQSSCFAS